MPMLYLSAVSKPRLALKLRPVIWLGLSALLSACANLGATQTESLGTDVAITASPMPTEGALSAPDVPDLAPAPPLRVIAVGDIMLDGTARPVMAAQGYDYAFAGVKHLLGNAPVVFGNLEGPLTDRGNPEQDKTYVFRSPPQETSRALVNAGFNVVSLANNHTLDYGAEGLAQTIETLDAAGIAHAGAGANLEAARQPVILEVGAKRIAILAYSLTFPEDFYAKVDKAGTAFGHAEHVRADIHAARKRADIVLVSFHWGQEGKTELRDYQIKLGHLAIDTGAAAVLGHHPHILQAVEHYKEGVILYSLGNFTFGSYSKTAQVSAIAELVFEGNKVHELIMHPINVNNIEVEFQPQPLAAEAATAAVTHWQELASARATTLLNENSRAVLRMPAVAKQQHATTESTAD